MPNTFFGVETGLRALRTAQAAMDTASHNIANVNTPGYSRQRVEFQVTNPYTTPSQWYQIGALQIGTGVEARAITQARDNALDVQTRGGYSGQAALVPQQDALSQVEGAIGEPGDSGINATMTRMFNSFHDLANNAESAPMRSAVLASAATLASTFHQIRGRVDVVQAGVTAQIASGVSDINNMAGQIATLNMEIRKVLAQGDQPNDLRDQRNNLLDGLAKKANTTVLPAPDGTVSVLIGGVALVRGTVASPIAGVADLTVNGDLTSGEMKGLLNAQGRVTSYQNSLDTLATAFMNQVNTAHQAGLDKNGAPGVALFTGTGAVDIQVNASVAANPDLVAAAAVPTPPATFAVGNGENALAIADLANTKVTAGPLAGQTLRDSWGGTAATLGSEVKALSDGLAGNNAFVKQLESRRDAISGVSIDEEMASLIKFQRAYQAAAKLISISDQMTDQLIKSF